MTTEQIKASIAPCGLSCEACFAYVDGDIRRYSLKLKEKLGNFDIYARRFETMVGNPVFRHYPAFKELLNYFAEENCGGCRNEQCKIFKGCGVRGCHQEKQVDFCYQCDAFPCDRTNFDDHLYERWCKINEIIRKIGIEKYHASSKERSRYP